MLKAFQALGGVMEDKGMIAFIQGVQEVMKAHSNDIQKIGEVICSSSLGMRMRSNG